VGAAVRIRYYGVTIEPGATMMLSSDGLHGVVAQGEMESILSAPRTELQDKCRNLVAAANAAGSPDNVTVVLIRQAC
jgi:protein phosphatase